MTPAIGDRIREARQTHGMSLRRLAGQVGIHYSHLSKVENGKVTIGKEKLIRIAEELGADPDLMLGEAGHAAMPYRVIGDVAAGVPIEAIVDFETFALSNVFDPLDHYLLRVRGDSMILDGINDGDLAIVRHTRQAKSGETVVALVDGSDATLKRFRLHRGLVVLTPASDEMQPITFPAERVEIRGVLAGHIRNSVS